MKPLSIERDGKKYDYQIRQLNAWDWSSILFEFTQAITGTKEFTANNIVAAINSIAQTGVEDKSVSDEKVAEAIGALKSGKFDILFNIAISSLNSLNEDRRNKIIDKALSAVWFDNGNPALGGGLLQLSLHDIDMYITHPIDMLLLVKESLLFNYKPVFDSFFKKAPSTK